MNLVDREGRTIDTVVDVGYVLYDLGAAAFEKIRGNDATASRHLKDAAADDVSALVPGYTAAATHLVRGVAKGAEAARAVDKAVDAGKAVSKGLNISDNAAKGKVLEKEVGFLVCRASGRLPAGHLQSPIHMWPSRANTSTSN